jgi:HEAT repeat protein
MSAQTGPDDRTQAELLYDLEHGTPREQQRALSRLTAVGQAEALDAVVDYLREQPPGQGKAGLDALRVLATKYLPIDRYSLAEVVTPFLDARDWGQRLIAIRMLNTHPNELAVEPLRDLIDEAREKVYIEHGRQFSSARVLAERILTEGIMALANCGRLMTLPDILELLEDPALRPIAARALGIIGSETERLRLEDLIEDDNVHVRDAAQWALGQMDERIEQFTNPPSEFPEPPPDRLSPIYWVHRQLQADSDNLLQFLIVRVAIEHLMLDALLSEGRIPETCLITVRSYQGEVPPSYKSEGPEVVGTWQYYWQGPSLRKLPKPPQTNKRPSGILAGRKASIVITYPVDLRRVRGGQVRFDCFFGALMGRSWIYHIARRDQHWTFARVQNA